MADAVYVMLGAGGHARVLQETLSAQGIALGGFIAPTSESRLEGVEWLGTDDTLDTLEPQSVLLVNGIGSTDSLELRTRVHSRATAAGFEFATVVDSSAIIRLSARVGDGAQVLAGAVVNSDASIGTDAIVNTGAIVEHGTRIGAHSHIAPRSVVSGDSAIGEGTHVGVGSVIIQGISVGSQCVIGAGAVVVHDVEDGLLAIGVPAKCRPRA